MPPPGEQNQQPNPAARPAPPYRRAGSVDGFAARRSFQRPVVARAPVAPPTTPPPAPLAPTVVSPPAPPVTAPDDEVTLALAGPTPITPAADMTRQPLTFETPVKPVASPEAKIKWRRLKSLATAGRRLGRVLGRRKVMIPVGIAALVLLVGWGAYAAVQYARTQASPDTIYREALANALMTQRLEVHKQSDNGTSTVLLDLASLKNPRISSQTTASIGGATYGFNTYGTAKDSFITYTSLPNGLPANTAAAVINHWVKLRQGGQLPAGINTTISNAADPRYQAFGPLVFANLDTKTSQTIARFLVDHKVYGYRLSTVKKVPLAGKNVLVFSGKFDADYSKIANQSVATSEGFSIPDVQRVVDSLTLFKGASSDLYVDPGKRLPLRLVLTTTSGQTVAYDYNKFNNVQLPAQPASSIDWPQFASTQLQIEVQASALQTSAQRDAMRQTNLTTIQVALAHYYSRNGFYPSLANLNNQTWVAVNLPSFDPDTTRDPQASTLALLAAAPTITTSSKVKNKTIAPTTPIYGYIYQPTTAAGKTCSNEIDTPSEQRCAAYSLAASLSDGQFYTVKSPQ